MAPALQNIKFNQHEHLIRKSSAVLHKSTIGLYKKIYINETDLPDSFHYQLFNNGISFLEAVNPSTGREAGREEGLRLRYLITGHGQGLRLRTHGQHGGRD